MDCVAAGKHVDRLDRVKQELKAHWAVLEGVMRHACEELGLKWNGVGRKYAGGKYNPVYEGRDSNKASNKGQWPSPRP